MRLPHFGLLTDLSPVAVGESCRSAVEHWFVTLKCHICGHRRSFYAVGHTPEISLLIILLDEDCMMKVSAYRSRSQRQTQPELLEGICL